jgi:hypothetical protein
MRGRQSAEGVRFAAAVGVLAAQRRRVHRMAVDALVGEVQAVLSVVDEFRGRFHSKVGTAVA